MKNPKLLRFLGAMALLTATGRAAEWRSLFNGKDLAGWDTWLDVPAATLDVPGLRRGADGNYTEALGLNRDPLRVFSVVQVEGKPAIYISGEMNGAIISKQEFGNYRLRVVFKWGGKNSRPDRPRNGGLLYHSHGERRPGDGAWLTSHEFQMADRHCGDYVSIVATGARIRARPQGRQLPIYDPKSEPMEFSRLRPAPLRCLKSELAENPVGEWNVLELVCYGDQSAHVVNGRIVMRIEGSFRGIERDSRTPLTAGKLQIQSEGSDLFVRSIDFLPLDAVPRELAESS